MIKIKSRYINICLIAIVVLILFFGFEWVNNLVSYKYEVQDFLQTGPDSLSGLNANQLGIIHAIAFCKYAMLTSCVLLIVVFIINEKMPSFRGRVQWI
jgi:uncharacterized membrane protein